MLSPLPRRSGWACQLSEIFRLPTSLTKRDSGVSWLMLRGLFVVKQPTVLDGLAFDPFSFQQDGLTAPEVDVGRGEIVDALVISAGGCSTRRMHRSEPRDRRADNSSRAGCGS